jgi:hypothetical protein
MTKQLAALAVPVAFVNLADLVMQMVGRTGIEPVAPAV